MEKVRIYAKWSGRFLYRAFEVFTLLLSCWITCAILLPNIRVNDEAKDGTVEIFIRSNGVHTDFVLPVRNQHFAWDTFVRPEVCNADSTYGFVAIGWGDKGFFLNTPTWDDLTFSTAFVAATGLGESAMHVDYLKTAPKTGVRGKKYFITAEQYKQLIDYITGSFTLSSRKVLLIDHAGYGARDKFFEANGRYSLFMTCNEWTGDGMQAAEMKVGIWTPLEFGIMQD
jgi:uncharacterized protein (TIGR02117 family)